MEAWHVVGLLLLPVLACAGSGAQPPATDAPGPVPRLSAAVAHPHQARDYTAIDAHALSAPRSAERSLASLAAYLAAPAADDAERARAVFRWITDRIGYDTEAYFSGSFRAAPNDAEGVLSTRLAVCDGYAALFEALARQAGLEARTLTGHAKGYGYQPGTLLAGPPQHAWNAVRIGGRWQLVDVTWGAGLLDEVSRTFTARFEPHFFLTPPEWFVHRHLPLEPRWQLLEWPISRTEFAALAVPQPVFFRHGLALTSHQGATVRAPEEAQVLLTAPPAVRLMAQLLRDGRPVAGAPVLVQRRAESVEVRVRPPRPGAYLLRVLSKPDAAQPLYESALEYRVLAEQRTGGGEGFPLVFREFAEREAWLEEPRRGRLPAGTRQRFALRVPGAASVMAVLEGRAVELEPAGDAFAGELQVPRGPFVLFARFAERRELVGLLRFEGI